MTSRLNRRRTIRSQLTMRLAESKKKSYRKPSMEATLRHCEIRLIAANRSAQLTVLVVSG